MKMYTPLLPHYAKTTWGAYTGLTGKNFNHAETQYSLMKALIDGHHHDDEIDTEATADATFFSAGTLHLNSEYDASLNSALDTKTNYWLEYQDDPPFYTGFDADKLDGQHYSDILAEILPIGSIIWFKGTDAEIPDGWKLCTGQAGTTDFRDYFVIGGGGSYDIDEIAGVATWNGMITPTGTVAVGDHVLTTSELPEHFHSYASKENLKDRSAVVNPIYTNSMTLYVESRAFGNQDEGSPGGSHGHPGSTISFTAIDPRPTYYGLYLIKKVS